jgi:hypothetical protein
MTRTLQHVLAEMRRMTGNRRYENLEKLLLEHGDERAHQDFNRLLRDLQGEIQRTKNKARRFGIPV